MGIKSIPATLFLDKKQSNYLVLLKTNGELEFRSIASLEIVNTKNIS